MVPNNVFQVEFCMSNSICVIIPGGQKVKECRLNHKQFTACSHLGQLTLWPLWVNLIPKFAHRVANQSFEAQLK